MKRKVLLQIPEQLKKRLEAVTDRLGISVNEGIIKGINLFLEKYELLCTVASSESL